jgi:hypothetical protein
MDALARLDIPERPPGLPESEAVVWTDEENARGIVRKLAVSAYFGVTVIDAFSDGGFDLNAVKQRTMAASDDSYEKLAEARVELSESPSSSLLILQRFRGSGQVGSGGQSS